MINVILADDHSLVRDGIKALLEESTDIKVIAEASNGTEALELSASLKPHILIVDIRMPGLSGIQTVSRLSHESPNVKALVLSMHDSEEYVLQSVESGAYGYLLKDTTRDEFIKAIHTINRGEKYFSADIATIIVQKYLEKVSPSASPAPKEVVPVSTPQIGLSKRQSQILKLVLSGMTNKEIAEHLGKSVRTIETHRFSLMKKLEVKNLAELTQKAREMGFVE